MKEIKEIKESKTEEWEDDESDEEGEEFPDSGNIMQFSDFVDTSEKHLQKQRITELRRRAEERQDWKRITGEIDLDLGFDESMEEET